MWLRTLSKRGPAGSTILRQVSRRDPLARMFSFEAKTPGSFGKPAPKVAWPGLSRSQFFAMGDAKEQTSSNSTKKQSAPQAQAALLADLKDLKKKNPGIHIDEKGDEFIMRFADKPNVCSFRIKVNGENELGLETASSPGILRWYVLNEYGQWNSPEDGHNLHGLLLRDMLPYIQGLPRFA